MLVGPSVRLSVGPVLFSKVKRTHSRRILRRVSGLVLLLTFPSSLSFPSFQALRPGEVGWVARARVPMPSSRDYVIRPKSGVDETAPEGRGSGKKALNRYELAQRKMQEKKKHSKTQRAMTVCIEGNKMPL